MRPAALLALAIVFVGSVALRAAGLTPELLDAFSHYVALTEARIDTELRSTNTFLWIDALPEADRRDAQRRLAKGDALIEFKETTDAGKSIKIPGGLIEHWAGVVFMPGVTLKETLATLQDYERYPKVFKDIRRAKILKHDDDDFKVYMRAMRKQVITVAFDIETDTQFSTVDATHVYSRSYSTHIAEVAAPETPQERPRPEGRDRGFLWRINNYGRFVERDGGTYMQFESISLSRDLPTGLGWVGPLLHGVIKGSLADGMKDTRSFVLHDHPKAAVQGDLP